MGGSVPLQPASVQVEFISSVPVLFLYRRTFDETECVNQFLSANICYQFWRKALACARSPKLINIGSSGALRAPGSPKRKTQTCSAPASSCSLSFYPFRSSYVYGLLLTQNTVSSPYSTAAVLTLGASSIIPPFSPMQSG
jgi:hypothetical protein